jgi:hypothetical protein
VTTISIHFDSRTISGLTKTRTRLGTDRELQGALEGKVDPARGSN